MTSRRHGAAARRGEVGGAAPRSSWLECMGAPSHLAGTHTNLVRPSPPKFGALHLCLAVLGNAVMVALGLAFTAAQRSNKGVSADGVQMCALGRRLSLTRNRKRFTFSCARVHYGNPAAKPRRNRVHYGYRAKETKNRRTGGATHAATTAVAPARIFPSLAQWLPSPAACTAARWRTRRFPLGSRDRASIDERGRAPHLGGS